MLQPPGGKPWLLYGLLSASLTLNLAMALRWPSSGDATAETKPVAATKSEAAPPSAVAAVQPPAATDISTANGTVNQQSGDYNLSSADVEQNVAYTFQKMIGEKGDADAIAAVYSRIFVWDVDLRREVQKKDRVTLAWKVEANGDVQIPVAWFRSSQLGQTFKAYQYQAPGDKYASYWYPDGTEVPFRLVNSPLDDYAQITSRLDDRVRHKGYDFKTDVGSSVKAPRAGVVERVNWNFTSNGDCVEVLQDDGVTATFLHLDKPLVEAGAHVTAGQVIARSGNTGHSTAPHLHYQVTQGERVLDPAEYHGTVRRHLPTESMASFQAEMQRLDAMLGVTPAAAAL